MINKNLVQYTIGLPLLILATIYTILKYDVSFQLKKDLIKYLWSPAK